MKLCFSDKQTTFFKFLYSTNQLLFKCNSIDYAKTTFCVQSITIVATVRALASGALMMNSSQNDAEACKTYPRQINGRIDVRAMSIRHQLECFAAEDGVNQRQDYVKITLVARDLTI